MKTIASVLITLAIGAASLSVMSHLAKPAVASPFTHSPTCCTMGRIDNPNGAWSLNLQQSTQYTFDLSTKGLIPSGGTWGANLGKIGSDGKYTVPTMVPPSALDVVTYTTTDGTVYSWPVTIANPVYPSPLQVPSGFLTPSSTLTTQPSTDLANVPSDGAWHEVAEVGSTTVLDTPAMLSNCEDLATAPVTLSSGKGTITGVAVPVTLDTYVLSSSAQLANLANTALTLKAPAGTALPKNCKIGPIYAAPPYKGQPCSSPGATQTVDGPVKIFAKRGPVNNNAGSIKVTAELAADLWKFFKLKVTVGVTLNFSREPIQYTAIQNYDKYKCVNGVWTYVGSGTCTCFANGELTTPFWVAWLDGYPTNGAPKEWSPWVCHMIP